MTVLELRKKLDEYNDDDVVMVIDWDRKGNPEPKIATIKEHEYNGKRVLGIELDF